MTASPLPIRPPPRPDPVHVDLRTGSVVVTPTKTNVDVDALAQVAFEAFMMHVDASLLWVELTADGRAAWISVAKAARDSLLEET